MKPVFADHATLAFSEILQTDALTGPLVSRYTQHCLWLNVFMTIPYKIAHIHSVISPEKLKQVRPS